MSKINQAQYGDIAQARHDKLQSFKQDLADVLEKHKLELRSSDDCIFVCDMDENIIGAGSVIKARGSDLDVDMSDFSQEAESFELEKSEPLTIDFKPDAQKEVHIPLGMNAKVFFGGQEIGQVVKFHDDSIDLTGAVNIEPYKGSPIPHDFNMTTKLKASALLYGWESFLPKQQKIKNIKGDL